MKLLIPKILTATKVVSLTNSEEFEPEDLAQDFEDCGGALLRKFSIHYTLDTHMYGMTLFIHDQKVNLDDIAMNTLFSDVFECMGFNYDLRYVGLGGAGCEFCLEITQRCGKLSKE